MNEEERIKRNIVFMFKKFKDYKFVIRRNAPIKFNISWKYGILLETNSEWIVIENKWTWKKLKNDRQVKLAYCIIRSQYKCSYK